MAGLKIPLHLIFIENIMSKEQKTGRENKKKALMTPKEKKAAKILRKESKNSTGLGL